MDLDILNKATEIIKKDQGIDPRKLANKEKASLIDALRMKYPLNELLRLTGMPKRSYFYQRETQKQPIKYAAEGLWERSNLASYTRKSIDTAHTKER